VLSREEVTARIISKKHELGLTWKGIAVELGESSPILYTPALLGQMTLTAKEGTKAAALFELTKEEAVWLEVSPER
jgi:cyanate lyase